MNPKINSDLTEIEKFDRLAKEWWDPSGPMKPLHQLNPLRLDFVKKYVNLAGRNIIDVGCGGGILSESLAMAGAKDTGIDLAAQALQVARDHAKLQGLAIDYIESPIEKFSEQHQNQFDAVTCMELLEHVPDPLSVIKACADLVPSSGKIFFSTINRTVKAFLLAIVGAEYVMNMLPKGTHQYDKFIKPSELSDWARSIGLNLLDLQGLEYHPLSGNFSFSQNVSVNYLICFEKP
jgi:2-polyprenyl-6-hydroxyphenyl methylase/3-demethylubiquinone-9 3-methyltransferase